MLIRTPSRFVRLEADHSIPQEQAIAQGDAATFLEDIDPDMVAVVSR
jgi:hypothetical protein